MAGVEESGVHVIQFAPLLCAAGAELWPSLAKAKLEQLGLSEAPLALRGVYEAARHATLSSVLRVEKVEGVDAGVGDERGLGQVRVKGLLQNFNTLEAFKACDRQALLGGLGREICLAITSGQAEEDPSLLSRVLLLTFADLKSYKFYYWFANPAILLPQPMTTALPQPQRLEDCYDGAQVRALTKSCEEYRCARRSGEQPEAPFWLLHGENGEWFSYDLGAWARLSSSQAMAEGGGSSQTTTTMVAMLDPSCLDKYPGWPLRNLLLLAAVRWRVQTLRVLCLRDSPSGAVDTSRCIVIDAKLPSLDAWWEAGPKVGENIKVTGWEKDARDRNRPRLVDLSTSLDPRRLASQAVDLNLKLMRWRMLPELQVEHLQQKRYLLVGAGTLGCNVSRLLLAWGARKITFIDNGKVSYSNPVRQSLYNFEDCANQSKPKAQVAADALRKIYPEVEAAGHHISIPMPGHPVSEGEKEGILESIAHMEELVENHDIVFLLTDTRESRWLPTLLCAAKKKLLINAALGFDSYVVSRHGCIPCDRDSSKTYTRLGCYFCNDVVAPLDSTSNRTLDQQCTVTRPGLANIAAAVAVELMVSLLHHPDGFYAPAEVEESSSSPSPLGLVPHTIRGALHSFSQLIVTGHAFSQCTACSECVVSEYQRRGHELILEAINNPHSLEDLTGLTELHAKTEEVVWDDDTDDEAFGEEDDDFTAL